MGNMASSTVRVDTAPQPNKDQKSSISGLQSQIDELSKQSEQYRNECVALKEKLKAIGSPGSAETLNDQPTQPMSRYGRMGSLDSNIPPTSASWNGRMFHAQGLTGGIPQMPPGMLQTGPTNQPSNPVVNLATVPADGALPEADLPTNKVNLDVNGTSAGDAASLSNTVGTTDTTGLSLGSSYLDDESERSSFVSKWAQDRRLTWFNGGDHMMVQKSEPVATVLPCVLILGPGEDLNSEVAIIMLRYLQEKHLLACKGVIANLKPSADRALLMRGTLDTLGLYDVPVGVGTDGGVNNTANHTATFVETAAHYMPGKNDKDKERVQAIKSGRRLLFEVFQNAEPHSMVLTLMSSLKDAALFLRDNQTLFLHKIRYVTVMGAVKPYMGAREHLEADCATAQNNSYDEQATRFFYKRCQDLGVPIITLSRHGCPPITKKLFNYLNQTHSPIGRRLVAAQKVAIEDLWRKVNAPVGSPERKGLPKRCDEKWFSNSFCNGTKVVDVEGESIFEQIMHFKMYDAICLLVSVPSLREEYFDGLAINVKGVEHLVLGESEENTGIRPDKIDDLKRYLVTGLYTGLSLNMTQAVDTVIISDPGQDQDDEMALVLLRALTERELVNCRGVVCNLCPSDARARLARGTLDVLGLDNIPVGVGSDGGSDRHIDNFSHTAKAYMPASPAIIGHRSFMGQELLVELYNTAPATGIRLLLISSIEDAAEFLRHNEEIFVEKTKDVTIMGGVKPFTAEDDGTFLEPDTAQNNTFNMEAAEFFYRRCQELKVPLVILSRHAAYRCPMPRSVYDRMARTGSPIGIRLQRSQINAIEDLWVRACRPDDDPLRLGLPPRCNKEWFCNTFCGGEGIDRDSDSSIWDLIQSFNMYDPLALLASIPQIRHRYFSGDVKTVLGVKHVVIGTSQKNHGVREDKASELANFMYNSFLKGVTLDWSEYNSTRRAVESRVSVSGVGMLLSGGARATGKLRVSPRTTRVNAYRSEPNELPHNRQLPHLPPTIYYLPSTTHRS
mmetsp:Transcript_43538/g.118256  ORF Transcript_43538/g.118256 Transcript_43538/m.118256 type:complete len:1013 (+) Transcript_43538:195-3233(+)